MKLYKIGSRANGTWIPGSDYDYLIAYDTYAERIQIERMFDLFECYYRTSLASGYTITDGVKIDVQIQSSERAKQILDANARIANASWLKRTFIRVKKIFVKQNIYDMDASFYHY